MKRIQQARLLAAMVCFATVALEAADWPMWRYDAERSADSPEKLPPNLVPAWTREYSPRTPAWEDPLNQDLMPFDTLFEPVAAGDRLFIGFNDRDKVVALDIHSGKELWAFYADGPVRLAPACANGKVYFTSDDGYLYCVKAEDGSLLWRFRGGSSERKALGNGRLGSAWPARGGAVIRDKTVYFAASIWPFMGTFIYALDAETGKVIWVNDGTGSLYMKQPHSAPAFGGVAPQGALVATDKILLVPGSRSVPAAFDRQTGKFLYYNLDASGKGMGGSTVMANETDFFVHTRQRGVRANDLKTGKKSTFILNEPVIGKGHYYAGSDYGSEASNLGDAEQKLDAARYNLTRALSDFEDGLDGGDSSAFKRLSNNWASAKTKFEQAESVFATAQKNLPATGLSKMIQGWKSDKSLAWEIKADASGDIIRAGGKLYAAGSNTLIAVQPPKGGSQASIVWTQPVSGSIRRLLAASGMLIGVTKEGQILAFGANGSEAKVISETFSAPEIPVSTIEKAKTILATSGHSEGYAFVLGLEEDLLTAALATQSKLHIIGVDADVKKVDRLRRQLDVAGLYGKRVTLLTAEPDSFGAPPFIANLVVADGAFAARLGDATVARKVYESVRPYGGALWIAGTGLAEKIKSAALPNAAIKEAGGATLVLREGMLPGSADWTHQYGSIANTVKSDDRTVKLPLGLLWFGGNTHMDVLPRHGHGPSEQVAGGRLVIEGMDCISARDVYTGRLMWKTVIPGLDNFGVYYDATFTNNSLTTLYNQKHIPGANARGANYVLTDDKVYVAISNHCVVLDAASGKIISQIQMPVREGQPSAAEWAYIGVYEDVLLGGAGFAHYNKKFGLRSVTWPPPVTDLAASAGLVAFNRHTGAVLWRVEATNSFIHNGIVAGKGRVYCLDRLPKSGEDKARRGGHKAGEGYRVIALELRTGKPIWEHTQHVFGTWLGYSTEFDVLLQAGASATDRLKDEASTGMLVFKGTDGSVLWHKPDLKYTGPCILYKDFIITTPTSYKLSAGAYRLMDGQPHEIANPLTGASQAWRVYRTYGCNTPVAAEHLMTFRSGAAGYYDLEKHSGAGNLGGFKSGCSANLIIANGVLNAPDYTRTCSCPYQNQTSLGLVHMPDAETWTCNLTGLDSPAGQRIKRVGINLGAPGDRVSDEGTLWVEYPATPGISPKLHVTVNDSALNSVFRSYSGNVKGSGPTWVTASGLRDVQTLVIAPQTLKAGPLPAVTGNKEDDDDDNGSKANNAAANAAAAPELADLPAVKYTVRLYFLDPDQSEAGRRVFTVSLQNQTVLENFDLAKEAGASNLGIMKEFKGITVGKELEVRLAKASETALPPVLSGVELILE